MFDHRSTELVSGALMETLEALADIPSCGEEVRQQLFGHNASTRCYERFLDVPTWPLPGHTYRQQRSYSLTAFQEVFLYSSYHIYMIGADGCHTSDNHILHIQSGTWLNTM